MTDPSKAKSVCARKRWPPCRAIRLLQHLVRHPHDQGVAMRLSDSRRGAALLHLAVLVRSRRNLRWHLGHIRRNLQRARRARRATRGSSASTGFA
jgi:hypothetical protein